MSSFLSGLKREEFGVVAKAIYSTVIHIVDYPDDVRIREQQGEQTLVIMLSVARSDIGKVIGKKGKMADALRTILMAVATKNGLRAVLEIES